MRSRHHALAEARIFRTCPPAHILNDPAHAAEVRRHLDRCAHCRSRLREETGWSRWAERLWEKLNSARHEPPEIIPGRLCMISPEAGQWHDGYFYNPPLVLVAEMPRPRFGPAKVFPIWHDTSLAGPGDLILSEAETGFDALFAEGWNACAVDAGLLEPTAGRVSPRIIETLNGLAENPAAYPDWALIPRPLTDSDPRIGFRRIETEVCDVFAGEKITIPTLSPPPYPAEDSAFRLRETAPGYHAAFWDESLKRISELPDFFLKKLEAGVTEIRDGQSENFRAISLEHKQFCVSGKTLTVRGSVANPAEMPADREISNIALVSRAVPQTAVKFSWNWHTGRFSAVFEAPADGVSETEDRWALLLILSDRAESE